MSRGAARRVDAYFEAGIVQWDVAAGIALMKAAGGSGWKRATYAGQVRFYAIDLFVGHIIKTQDGLDLCEALL